jgi:hypothetical protein
MTEVIERLLADMRWRLSPAAGRYRPSNREAASWGALQIAWPTKLLSGCGLMIVSLGGLVALDKVLEPLAVVCMCVMFLGIPIAFWASSLMQRSFNLKAYKKMLESNERFTLVEYARLLQRHIEMAQRDPALGGAKEVARLQGLQAEIVKLLESGAGLDGTEQQSTLGDEAELAESLLESYNIGKDEMQELDSRLPDELRAKLQEVDRAAHSKPERQAE